MIEKVTMFLKIKWDKQVTEGKKKKVAVFLKHYKKMYVDYDKMIGKFAMFCRNMLDWFKSDRCFVKYFIDAFGYVNKNILLVMLIVLFTYAITIYVLLSATNGTSSIIMLTIVMLLTSAMASGLFYSIKKGIEKTSEDEEVKPTYSVFYSGVGKHYLSFLGIMFMFFLITTGVIAGTFITANFLICDISELGVSIRDFFYILADPSIGASVFEQLSKEQQTHFRDWNRLFLITTQTLTMLLLYWIPEKMYTKKNIFISLFGGIKKVLTDLPNTICIYLTILLLNFIVTVLISLVSNIAIVSFIISILSMYLLVYNFFVIFLYYKARYIDVYERGEIE